MYLKKEMVAQLDDKQLWQGFREGDLVSFNFLVEKFSGSLFNYGARFCNDREIVQDCIQELFIELWNKQTSIITPGSVKWYLFTALRNRVFRAQTKWNRTETINPDEYEFFLEFDIEQKIITVTEDIELIKKVKKILETLPPRQREVVYLKYYENLSFDQIAEVMNLNKQSVHNLLQKAYNSIRGEWTFLIVILLKMHFALLL
jgi:RNA polymerase sigma factor (sigma-70 family)